MRHRIAFISVRRPRQMDGGHRFSPNTHMDSFPWCTAARLERRCLPSAWGSCDGIFSVSSLFSTLLIDSAPSGFWHSLWKIKAPPRVTTFAWLALRKKILTKDNLLRRNMVVVNACPLCLADEETVDHLLLHCKMTKALWSSILNDFNCCWVLPESLPDFFQQWISPINTSKGKTMPYPFWHVSGQFGKRETEDASKGPLRLKKT